MPSACRLCQAGELQRIFHLPAMPLVGSFSRDRDTAIGLPRHDLDWCVCPSCGGVQLLNPVEDTEIFGSDYSFSTGTIPSLVKHFEDLADQMVGWFELGQVLEFGSNDGTLLGHLKDRGVKAIGIDPSENVAAIARSKGLPTYTGFLNRETALQIREEHGRFDVISGSNCFAHNISVHPILEGIVELIKYEGTLCLEVIYAEDVYSQLQWDSLYHEHVYLYSLGTLTKLLAQYGLIVFIAQRHPMHAGSLRVYATPDKDVKVRNSVPALLRAEAELGLDRPATWKAFGQCAQDTIDVVRESFGAIAATSRVWGYGASGRAAMWANACGHTNFEAIVDASPLRAGRFLPGTGTPIISVDEARVRPQPDHMFVYSWNYIDAIVKQADFYRGTWVTPVPKLSLFKSSVIEATSTATMPPGFNKWVKKPDAEQIPLATIADGAVETGSYVLPGGSYLEKPVIASTVAPRFGIKYENQLILTRLNHNYTEARQRYANVFAKAKTVTLDLALGGKGRLCVLGGHSNFYHFISNYLARAYFYTENGAIRRQDRFLIDKAMPAHYQSYYALLGIRPDQLVPVSADEYIQCQEAYWSSLPHYFDHEFGLAGHAEAFRWFNETIRQNVKSGGQRRRLMLSRRDTPHRRIVNEDALFDIAERYGFERILPENHPVPDLLGMLAEAEMLITPYGAGATNVLFTRPGSKVIELVGGASVKRFNTAALCALAGASLTRVVGAEQQMERDWAYRDLMMAPDDFKLALDVVMADPVETR